jgi:alpha-tubulin suppressor-like RCC1 family protein
MKTGYKILTGLLLLMLAPLCSFAQSTQLTGGNNFSVGLCGSGAIYAWGSNTSGQVGQGTLTTTQYTSPTAVLGFPAGLKFSQVNAGSGAHALALDCNKNIWSWGENQCGQTGNGGSTASCGSATSVPQATPAKVVTGAQGDASGFLSNIIALGGGNNFSMAIESGTGKVYAWGQNADGELGNGTTTASSTPVVVQKCSGGALTNIVMIQGGDQSAYALDASGKVWTWGDNSNHNLGNGTANSSCAIAVTTSSGAQLKGIKMIAAGDTHGMALDSTGQVWTWGGDWGPGQLGQGTTYISNAYASRVVAPNNFTATGAAGPWITNATYIAAGQASSTVVLSDGSVVSFGAYGLYPGPSCGASTLLFSGTLGTGHQAPNNATCNSNSTRGTSYPPGASVAGYGTPEYVMTNSTTKLANIVSVARGDAWYFAIDASGNTYAWGFNGANGAISALKGGELGIGNTTDQPFAVPVTLPAGCGTISSPCPLKPSMGADNTVCPGSSFTLNPNESATGYTYTWLSSATGGAGSFTTIAGTTSSTYTTTMVGSSPVYYAVQINATSPCGPCPTVSDTIKVSPLIGTFTGSGTFCGISPNVQFTVTDPSGKAKFQWFLNQSPSPAVPAGVISVVNSANSSTITLPQANSNQTFGASCPYSLFAQDTATYSGALQPAQPCATTTTLNVSGANGALTLIKVNKAITIDSMQFVAVMGNSSTGTFGFSIYNQVPKGTAGSTDINCNSPQCAPSSSTTAASNTALYTSPTITVTTNSTGGGSFVKTIKGSYTLAPGNYWIGFNITNGGGNVQYQVFQCNPANTTGVWSTQIADNTGFNIVDMISAGRQSAVQDNGGFFNIQFRYASPYSCGRLQVCATNGTCPLPVNIVSFTAEKQSSSILLDWTTATEQNTSYFEVQKSVDGINFTSIGQVPAAGNSNGIKNYSFTDNSTENTGIIYYRLQEYDKDGKFSLSGVQSVSTGIARDVKIVPNPNAGKFNVILDGDPDDVHIVLLSTMGEELLQINNTSAENAIDIQNLASGVYFLHVRTSTASWIKKVVKQ